MEYRAFCGASYESQSWAVDAERAINFFFEPQESQGASTRSALYPTPGVTTLATSTNSPGRGHFFMEGREFAVFGTSLEEISQTGAITIRGTLAADTNPATISSNGDGGDQLFITSGGNGYILTLSTNVLTQIAALNGKATMGGYLDGYFLALDANNSTFYISALLDGSTWATGTDFAQRSAAPDPWLSMVMVGQFIWLLGELTSEVWYDTGNASFPFGLHPSGRVPFGIAASFSARVADGSLIWLGSSTIGKAFVLRAAGFNPEVVSDYPRQAIFSEYANISDAIADTINYLGHVWYVITFPQEDVTWVYDLRTNLWFQWQSWAPASSGFVALRNRWLAMAFGVPRMLDSQTGAIYTVSKDSSTDVDGQEIRRLRRAPDLSADLQRVFYKSLELDIQPGVGLVSGQGSDPQIMLRVSRDGGQTWGPEIWRSLGKIGEFGTRVRWTRLGMARRFVAEVTLTDPVAARIGSAYLELGQPIKGQQQAQGAA